MNRTNISWADYTWNVVTGCKRGCVYCYARKIHNRFNKTPFSEIVFHPERLNDPAKIKKPSTIFVGSMSDCQYWSYEQTVKILDACEYYFTNTYMFLSKSPEYLPSQGWEKKYTYSNIMQGLTVEMPGNAIMWNSILRMRNYYRSFLSIEPIAGGFYKLLPEFIELVIVGAETGNRKDKIIPKKQWIQSIIDNVPAEKIHWKPNIVPYLNEYGFDTVNLLEKGTRVK